MCGHWLPGSQRTANDSQSCGPGWGYCLLDCRHAIHQSRPSCWALLLLLLLVIYLYHTFIHLVLFSSYDGYELNWHLDLFAARLHNAQLVEHCTSVVEVYGFESCWSLRIFSQLYFVTA